MTVLGTGMGTIISKAATIGDGSGTNCCGDGLGMGMTGAVTVGIGTSICARAALYTQQRYQEQCLFVIEVLICL